MELTRGLDPGTLAAIAAGAFFPAVLLYLDWPGAPVRAHSGAGALEWAGETWSGVMVGNTSFGRIEVPEEAASLVPAEAELRLVVPEAEIETVLDANIRNLTGAIYFGVVSERAGNVLIGEPFEVFSGYMDAASEAQEEVPGGVANIVRIALGVGPPARANATVVHSYEDQIGAWPGDTIGRLLINQLKRAQRVQF